jgi:3-deoxy-D-manno-octulosonic-acid transferase
MEDFRDIARLFLDGNAAVQIKGSAELRGAIHKILSNPKLAADLGKNARKVVDQNTGATERVLTFLRPTEVRR